MKSTKLAFIACAVVALTNVASADSFTGPTSTFYMTVANSYTIWAVQGTTVTTFAWDYDSGGGPSGEGILAVSAADGVSTAPNGAFTGTGGQYTLAGVPTGVANDASIVPAVDATSDGTYNYYTKSGPEGPDTVYQSNLDWSDPTVLFNTLAYGAFQGIGFDPANDSLWMVQTSGYEIADFSLTGVLLSSFVQTTSNRVQAFGFDPADGTMWGEISQTGELAQWNTSGTLLQEGTPVGLEAANYRSGDFEEGGAGPVTTPEPTTLFLTGSGLLVLVRRLRKK
jgi:hypothetical protein